MAKADTQANKSNREKFLSRFAERHPDIDTNDEEAYYGAINDDADERDQRIKKYEDDEKVLGDAFQKDPRIANLFLSIARGENPLLYLVESFGSDFVDYLNDPDNEELRKQFGEKQKEYVEKQAKSRALQEQTEKNIDNTLDAFDRVADELGADDELKEKVFNYMAELQERLLVDDIDEKTWKIAFNSITHDDDVAQAGEEGEIRGRNAKIDERLRKPKVGVPPQLNGQGARKVSTKQAKFGGVLDEIANETPWYEK